MDGRHTVLQERQMKGRRSNVGTSVGVPTLPLTPTLRPAVAASPPQRGQFAARVYMLVQPVRVLPSS